MPAGVTNSRQGMFGNSVHQTAIGREHDVVYVELFQGVLKVVPASFAVPVVAKGYRQRLHAVNLGEHMELKSAVLAATYGDDAVIVVARGGFSCIESSA